MISVDMAEKLKNTNTPCYIFNPEKVIENYSDLKQALGTGLIVSFKANPSPDLFRRVVHVFDAIELASIGELDAVVMRTNTPKFINNPSLDGYSIRAGIASKSTVVIDNIDQVEHFIRLSATAAAPPPVLRINGPSSLGLERRAEHTDYFGMDKSTLWLAADMLCQADIKIRGLHVFNGSYNFKKNSQDLAPRLLELLQELESRLGYQLTFLNLGGGFPENWRDMDFDFEAYRNMLAPIQKKMEVFHESGRGVFGQCGTFVTRVVGKKTIDSTPIVICDGGMAQNYLLSKASNPLRKLQHPEIIRSGVAEGAISEERARVVGSTCNSMDCIGEIPAGEQLPNVGDYCLFHDCGAYNHTYTVADFLSSKKATIYLWS